MTRRPYVISTRVAKEDRASIYALAELESTTVCEVLYRVIVPAVRSRIIEIAAHGAPGLGCDEGDL